MQLDLIVYNARIVTMDDSRPEAHSMGIWRGIITGFDEQLDSMTAAETFDAAGDCVLPGFIDGHTHCAVTGFRYGALDISTCSDIAAVLDTIGRAAADVETGGWLDVFGYDQRAYGRDITAVEIDAVVDGRRVWIRHDSSHSSIVSTNVLTAAVAQGWKRAIPASGLLLEDEQKLVFDQRLPYSPDEIESALISAGERCLSDGITMCVEAGIGGGLLSLGGTELAAYQNLAGSGRLPVRMQVMVSRDVVHEVATTDGPQRVIDLGLRTGLPLPGTPLKAIQFLAQRRTSSGAIVGGGEVISVDEAIAIFTRDAAWGSHKDEQLGTLTAGKRADFIVLDDDLREVPVAAISDIGVQRAYIDGVLRWQRS